MDFQPQRHFHIRWDSGQLDWEPFNSPDEAEERAKQIVPSRETYSIEQFAQPCDHCKAWREKLLRAKSHPFS